MAGISLKNHHDDCFFPPRFLTFYIEDLSSTDLSAKFFPEMTVLSSESWNTLLTDTTLFYEIYIEASVTHIWEAITSPHLSGIYWGHSNVSTWNVGAHWSHQRLDGSGIADVIGEIQEIRPTELLKFTWQDPHDLSADISIVTIKLRSWNGITHIRLTHENLSNLQETQITYGGWVAVLSNMKTYLETGKPMSTNPWELA